MEIWQIAETLGVLEIPHDGKGRSVRSRRDLIAERMRAARGEAAEPEPDPLAPETVAFMDQYRRIADG